MGGLLVRGREVEVPGVTFLNRNDDPELALDSRDHKQRETGWVRIIVLHTTKGMKTQRILPGVGPSLRGKRVAQFWDRDPQHSGAHIVIGSDGVGCCLADVVSDCAHHASNRYVNDRSIGIEIYQESDGSVFQAAINAAVATCRALVALDDPAIAIQWQHQRMYRGAPLKRLLAGGGNVVGIVGHRDVTADRGWGDPGDLIFTALEAAGCEPVDFATGQDLDVWADRQRNLGLTADGVAGRRTRLALEAVGYANGIYRFGKGPT